MSNETETPQPDLVDTEEAPAPDVADNPDDLAPPEDESKETKEKKKEDEDEDEDESKETVPAVAPPVEGDVVTEKILHARFKGNRAPSAQKQGAGGTSYFFERGIWVKIEIEDHAEMERKATNNPNNWEVQIRENPILVDVHKMLFKGNDLHPDGIELDFTEEEDKPIKYKFKTWKDDNQDYWVTITQPHIVEILSNKALNQPKVWGYQIHRAPLRQVVETGVKATPEELAPPS